VLEVRRRDHGPKRPNPSREKSPHRNINQARR
jgi:hypothetical protein